MTGKRASIRDRFALGLLALALAVRILIPSGWMPTATAQGFAITVCTGGAVEQLWVDEEGQLHKQAPQAPGDQHCAFAGLTAPLTGGDAPVLAAPFARDETTAARPLLASIGHGLAAPPPPATGPPASI